MDLDELARVPPELAMPADRMESREALLRLEMIRGFQAEPGIELDRGQLEPAWLAVRERLGSGADLSAARSERLQRRPVSFLIAAAALVSLLVALPAILPSARGGAIKARAVVSFSSGGGYIVALIRDPNADSEALRQAFAEHGLDITLQLIPVSPSAVGTFVYFSWEDEAVQEGGPAIETLASDDPTCTTMAGGSCQIGIRVPVDFQGHADIGLGRPAHPGEKYRSGNDGYAAGEALHCSGLYGMTVQAALPVLSDRGVTAIWRSMDRSIDTDDGIEQAIIAGQYVTDAIPAAPGEMYIWVTPDQPPPLQPSDYLQRRDQDC
jgi:hypothetical protein